MSARPRARCARALVRTSQRCRLEQQLLERAYELALPVIRRRLADATSARSRPARESFPVPRKLVGG
jgi:hypothetical protein